MQLPTNHIALPTTTLTLKITVYSNLGTLVNLVASIYRIADFLRGVLIFTFFASQNNLVKINLILIKVSGTNVHVCAAHTFLCYYPALLLQQQMDQCSSQLSSSLCRITVTD